MRTEIMITEKTDTHHKITVQELFLHLLSFCSKYFASFQFHQLTSCFTSIVYSKLATKPSCFSALNITFNDTFYEAVMP